MKEETIYFCQYCHSPYKHIQQVEYCEEDCKKQKERRDLLGDWIDNSSLPQPVKNEIYSCIQAAFAYRSHDSRWKLREIKDSY